MKTNKSTRRRKKESKKARKQERQKGRKIERKNLLRNLGGRLLQTPLISTELPPQVLLIMLGLHENVKIFREIGPLVAVEKREQLEGMEQGNREIQKILTSRQRDQEGGRQRQRARARGKNKAC